VSLEVASGEIVGLAGLMGAGRTELLETIFGRRRRGGGQVLAGGHPISGGPAAALRSGLAMVGEDRRASGVVPEMSVAANLGLARHRRPLRSPRAVEMGLLPLLQDFRVKAACPTTRMAALSGGNQQKVLIARALAAEPRVLLLDEPTRGVDIGAKHEIHERIRRLAERGVAVLMASSDLPEILELSDRILVMRAGRLVAELPGGVDEHTVIAAAAGQAVAARNGARP
jgi:ribose transport system ATP-binding protein